MSGLTRDQLSFIKRMERLSSDKYTTLAVLLSFYKSEPSERTKKAILKYVKDEDDKLAAIAKAREEGREEAIDSQRQRLATNTRARIRTANNARKRNIEIPLTSINIKGSKNKAEFYKSSKRVNKSVISWNILLTDMQTKKARLYTRLTHIIAHLKNIIKEDHANRQILNYTVAFPYASLYKNNEKYIVFQASAFESLKKFKDTLHKMTLDESEGGSDSLQEDGVNSYIANTQAFTIRFFLRSRAATVHHSCYTPDKYCVWFGKDNKITNCGYQRGKEKIEVNCVIDFLFKNFRCFAREITTGDDMDVATGIRMIMQNKRDEDNMFTEAELITLQGMTTKYYSNEDACTCDPDDDTYRKCKKTFSIVENVLHYRKKTGIDISEKSKYSTLQDDGSFLLDTDKAKSVFELSKPLVEVADEDSICMILDSKLKHIFCFKGTIDKLRERKIREDIYIDDNREAYIKLKKNKKHIVTEFKKEMRDGLDSIKYDDLSVNFPFDYESVCDLEAENLVKPFLVSVAPITIYEFLAFGIINITLVNAIDKELESVAFDAFKPLVEIVKKHYPYNGEFKEPVKTEEKHYEDTYDSEPDAEPEDEYAFFEKKLNKAIRGILNNALDINPDAKTLTYPIKKAILVARRYGMELCKHFLSYDCTYEMMEYVYHTYKFNEQNRVGCLLGFNNASFDNFLLSHDLYRCKSRLQQRIGSEIQISTFQYSGQMLGLNINTNAQLYTHDVRKYLTNGSLSTLCKDYRLVIFEKQKLEDDVTHVELQNKYNELGPKAFLKYMKTKTEYIDYCKYDTLSTMLLFSVYTITMQQIDAKPLLTTQMRNKIPITHKYLSKITKRLHTDDEKETDDEKYNVTTTAAGVINKIIGNTFAKKTIGSHAKAINSQYWKTTRFEPPKLNLEWYNLIKPGRVAGRVDMFAKQGRYDENTHYIDNIYVNKTLATQMTKLTLPKEAKDKTVELVNQFLHSFDMCGQYQYMLTCAPVWYPGGENCETLEVLNKSELIKFKQQRKKEIEDEKAKKAKLGSKYTSNNKIIRNVADITIEDLDDKKSEYYHICNESHVFETRKVYKKDGKAPSTPDDYNNAAMKRQQLGWFVCDVDQEVLRYRNLPYFAPKKVPSGNDFECGYIKDAVMSSVEVSYMRSLGCTLTLKKGIVFTQSRRSYEIFKPLLAFMAIKNEQDMIKAGKIKGVYNQSLRETSKMIPNAVSGKINESIHQSKLLTMTAARFEKTKKMLDNRNEKRDDDEEKEKIAVIDVLEDDEIFVNVTETLKQKLGKQFAMSLGGFVYAYSRIFMYEFVYKHIGLLASIYADTDACKGYTNAFEEWLIMAKNTTVPHWKEVEEYDPRYINHPLYSPDSKIFGSFEDEMSKFNKGVKFEKGHKVVSYTLQKKTWSYIQYDKDGKVLNAKMRAKGVSPSNAVIRLEDIPDLSFLSYNKQGLLSLDIYNKDGSTNIDKYKQFSDYVNNPKNQLFYGAKSEEELAKMKDPNRYNNIDYFFYCAHVFNTAYILGTSFTRNVKNPCRNVELGEYDKYYDKTGTLSLRCMLKKIVPRLESPRGD